MNTPLARLETPKKKVTLEFNRDISRHVVTFTGEDIVIEESFINYSIALDYFYHMVKVYCSEETLQQ